MTSSFVADVYHLLYRYADSQSTRGVRVDHERKLSRLRWGIWPTAGHGAIHKIAGPVLSLAAECLGDRAQNLGRDASWQLMRDSFAIEGRECMVGVSERCS